MQPQSRVYCGYEAVSRQSVSHMHTRAKVCVKLYLQGLFTCKSKACSAVNSAPVHYVTDTMLIGVRA